MPTPTITARELEVLKLVAGGRNNPQIATALGIAPGTVKVHMQNIGDKLSVSGRDAMVREAKSRGLLA